MNSILIQNAFINGENDNYLFSCKVFGEIKNGDYIICNYCGFNIEIKKVEKKFLEAAIISIKKDSFSPSFNISQLYGKKFEILTR